MHGVIRLRLRPAGILCDETIHQIENDFLRDEWDTVNFCEALRTKTRALGETPPDVDVRHCHIVKATGDAVHFTAAHYQHIDDVRYLSGYDTREITTVNCALCVRTDHQC